eukprot:m.17156 g.17156  ORF g.17156 m.17156 type:complete len:341 (-) comp10989_c0_seq2:54-1076(-)
MALPGLTIVYCGPSEDELATELELVAAISPDTHIKICETTADVRSYLPFDCLVLRFGAGDVIDLVRMVQKTSPSTFICILSKSTSASPERRFTCFENGAHMVTDEWAMVRTAVHRIVQVRHSGGKKVTCPECHGSIPSHGMFFHFPLYHISAVNKPTTCPICNENTDQLQPHIHFEHAPAGVPKPIRDSPIKAHCFALVFVQRPSDGHVLLVHEFASKGYWLLGGHVNQAETLHNAALREAREETGVDIKLCGILSMNHSASEDRMRMSVVFYAEPQDENNCKVKTISDFESAGAVWASQESILSGKLKLRTKEPVTWLNYLQQGGTVFPLSMLRSNVRE